MFIHTESGTVYDLDLDAKTVTRYAGDTASQLRKDGQTVPLLETPTGAPVVGLPFVMVIDVRGDGVETIRTTTRVTKVEIPTQIDTLEDMLSEENA
jgi:hypothetical protein